MTNFEINRKEANELKGNYQFKSPYHKGKKMLPFNVLGFSFNEDYPIEVYTVEYRGYTKKDHYGNYKTEVIREFIESGFLTKV
jgi:hypothetical protein